jgi:endogenous inhibitor of DNA gyrase (YacG/DUF329 family)
MTNCPQCHIAMPTPTGRSARRRYCSDACRKTAWEQRHRDTNTSAVHSDAADDHPAVRVLWPAPVADDVATPDGQHRCPNCRKPLTIINVVIPADAAIVKPP